MAMQSIVLVFIFILCVFWLVLKTLVFSVFFVCVILVYAIARHSIVVVDNNNFYCYTIGRFYVV